MRELTFDLGLPRGANSFQSRIAGMALLTAAVVLLAASGVFIVQQWASDRMVLERHQTTLAQVIASQAAKLADSHDPQWAQDSLLALTDTADVTAGYLFDADGRLLAAYGAGQVGQGVQTTDEHFIKVRAPVLRGGRRVAQVVLLSDATRLGSILPRYLAVTGALFFAAASLALFVAKWLAARVIEPVNRLSDAMDLVAESGDFDQQVEPFADDELGRLTDTFNGLLRKLQSNDEALKLTVGELVEARDAAEAANVLKSQFLANMSHEIRTPLNGVLAMAQIMAMGELTDVQRERLDVVRQSGEALLAILNDVLDLSKIEAGKMELESSEFDPAEIGRSAEAAFAEVAAKRGLSFVVDVQDSAVGRRRGDLGRLRQISANLLSNALKFTENGEVRLTLSGEVEDGRDVLHLIVADTGIGIPAAKRPLLFQKFTQVDSSTTRRFGGTGLGLAICRELAGLMGGRMWVDSNEGEGSVFHLVAPLPRVEQAPPVPAQASAPVASAALAAPMPEPVVLPGGGHATRVLAAEDNPTNQLVLRTIMQTFGVDLTMVADGRLAVEAWEKGDFELILMDIQMPVMDGVAATRTIRDAEAATGRRRTPIIALSANAMTHQVREYLGAGMDMHVAKPIQLAKLHSAIRTLTADPAAEAPEADSAGAAA